MGLAFGLDREMIDLHLPVRERAGKGNCRSLVDYAIGIGKSEAC